MIFEDLDKQVQIKVSAEAEIKRFLKENQGQILKRLEEYILVETKEMCARYNRRIDVDYNPVADLKYDDADLYYKDGYIAFTNNEEYLHYIDDNEPDYCCIMHYTMLDDKEYKKFVEKAKKETKEYLELNKERELENIKRQQEQLEDRLKKLEGN